MTDHSIVDVARIEEKIQEAERVAASTSDESASVLLTRERSVVRTHATRVVIWVYAGVLGAIVLFIIAAAFVTRDFDRAEAQLIDLVKTALIPIVTFVIGHYFGSSGR